MNDSLTRAWNFLLENGRLLERRRFSHLFRGAAAGPVIGALRAYQNGDGGFGNALEPDKRCVESQPVDQEIALRVLDEGGFDQPLARELCDFLLTITTGEGGVPFVLPSVASAPRAPWWNSPPNPPASLNPTAALVGLLHKHGVDHPWLGPATDYCWAEIAAMPVPEAHLLRCIFTFLEDVPDRARAGRQFDRIAAAMMASDVISLDPDAEGYVHGPLDFASTPESLCRPLFEDRDVGAHLDKLAAQQQEDGGWPISWPPASAMGGLEYRGMRTLDALRTLRAYGHLAG